MKNKVWFFVAFARLIKIEHTLFSVPMMLGGMLLASPNPNVRDLGFALIAVFGARTAAMAWNRVADRDIDAMNPRTAERELPRGVLTPRQALFLVFGGFFIYVLSAFLLSPTCGLLSPLPALVFLGYPYLKRFTHWCHFGIGLALAFSPLGGFLAVTKTLPQTFQHPQFPSVLLLAFFVLLWVSAFDIYYTFLDVEFDRTHGIHSFPVRYGLSKAKRFALMFHILASILAGMIIWFYSSSIILAGVAFLSFMVLFFVEYRLVEKDSIPFAFFQLNIIIGTLLLFFIYMTRFFVDLL